MLTSVFGPPTNLTAQFGGQQLEIDCQPSLRPTKKVKKSVFKMMISLALMSLLLLLKLASTIFIVA